MDDLVKEMMKTNCVFLESGGTTIPDEMPTLKGSLWSNEVRIEYVELGMFAFVSWRWVNPFVEWLDGRKCLEVMAGRGILAKALRQKGIGCIATDDFSWSKKEGFEQWKNPVTDVEKMDAVQAVETYGGLVDVLVMSWPRMDNTAYQVIKRLHEVNPDVLIVYIGEGGGEVQLTVSSLTISNGLQILSSKKLITNSNNGPV